MMDALEREFIAAARTFVEGRLQSALVHSLGQVKCIGGHEDWWLPATGCPWCKARV